MSRLALCCPTLSFDNTTIRTAKSFLRLKEKLQIRSLYVETFLLTSCKEDIQSAVANHLFDNIKYNEPNGVYSAFNDCIKNTFSSEFYWIWILGSGDSVELTSDESLEIFAHALIRKSNPFTMIMKIGDRALLEKVSCPRIDKWQNLDKARFNHPAMVVPVSIYRTYGLYNENYKVISDFLWFHELSNHNIKFDCLPIVGEYHELGGISTVSSKSRIHEHFLCIGVLFKVYGLSIEVIFGFLLRLVRYLLGLFKRAL